MLCTAFLHATRTALFLLQGRTPQLLSSCFAVDLRPPASAHGHPPPPAADRQTPRITNSSVLSQSSVMAPQARTRARTRLLCIPFFTIVVLALALGLGLGLGLRHHTSSASESTSNTSSDANSSSLLALTPQAASNFVLRGAKAMASEPSQTRSYNFVLEERAGSPDGFEKTMLVVNGTLGTS